MDMQSTFTVMSLPLLLLLLPLLLLFPDVAYNMKYTQWTRNASSDDLVFPDHLLWSLDSVSRIGCAKLCAEDDACQTFTFTRTSSQSVTCRGHSQSQLSGGSALAGTVYFDSMKTVLTPSDTQSGPEYILGSSWLQKPCSSNDDCSSVVSAECFQNRCLCTPGYYFSTSKDTCHDSCSDIQDDFIMYPKWYLSFNNLGDDIRPWADCRAWCLSLPDCVTLEYNYPQSKCYVAAVTVLDTPSYWKAAKGNLSYWQRTCA